MCHNQGILRIPSQRQGEDDEKFHTPNVQEFPSFLFRINREYRLSDVYPSIRGGGGGGCRRHLVMWRG